MPEFEKRWQRYARPVGGSRRMDETYIKVRGQWVYLYRGGQSGPTVDFFLSRNRDVNAAKSRNAMKNIRIPRRLHWTPTPRRIEPCGRCKETADFRVASGLEPARI
jgi:hypothetical protein